MAKGRQGNRTESDQTPPPPAAVLLSRRELAAAFNVHMMTVTKWERNGLPIAQRGGPGRPSYYDKAVVGEWLRVRDAAAQARESVSLEDARIRKELSQAALNEQRLAVQQRRLLPVEEVEKAWTREVTAIRTVILASYTTHADRIFRAGTLEGIVGVERELKALAHEVLRELADPKPKKTPRAKKTAAA